MVALATVKRRIWLFTMLSLVFFIASLLPVVVTDLNNAEMPTYYCNLSQLQTMRTAILALPWAQTCPTAKGFVDALLPTSLDVRNKPVNQPTLQKLNSFCTKECVEGIKLLQLFPFQPCDTVLDDVTRSLGSVLPRVCANGTTVVTVPPAPTIDKRAGKYCKYSDMENAYGVDRPMDLRSSKDKCTAAANKVFFASTTMDGIPYNPITQEMVNDICVKDCQPLVARLKNFTHPPCDTVIEDITISLSNVSARMCVVSNVSDFTIPTP